MLTYLLALVVGSGSFALYMSAFFYPDLYRKGDLVWSGVGLFYALVLWFSAERITGGVLLGQIASVSLIGWLGWQALTARSGHLPADQRTTDLQTGLEKLISSEQRSKITAQINQQAGNLKEWGQALFNTAAKPQVNSPSESYQPLKPEDFGQPPVTIETPANVATVEAVNSEIAPVTVPPPVPTPPKVVVTPSEIPKAVSDRPNPTAVITDLFKSVTGVFNKPKKNTSTYVRKEFRDPLVEATLATAIEGAPVIDTRESPPDATEAAQDAVTEATQDIKDSLTEAAKDQVDAFSEVTKDAQGFVAEVAEVTLENLDQIREDLKETIADTHEPESAIASPTPNAGTDTLDNTPSIKVAETVGEDGSDRLDDIPNN